MSIKHIANPHEKWYYRNNGFAPDGGAYIVTLGTFASPVLAYADSYDGAVEVAAEYAVGKEWFGLVTPHENWEPCSDSCAHTTNGCDCTYYTEAGNVVAWELMVEGPMDRDELIRFSNLRGNK